MNKELREYLRLKKLMKDADDLEEYNFYDHQSIDNHLENDCISSAEYGFMLGYLDT